MTVERTLVERYFNCFLFVLDFLSLAHLALFAGLDNLPLTSTGITILLHLLDHSRTHLIGFDHAASSFASLASFHLRTSLALTSLTTSDSLNRHFHQLSLVTLL